MAEKFDPYYTWLGIPQEDQPPDHYALIGVRQFESNPDVISNLTDQRMAHVKTFHTGPHGAESQKLLNEIAAARVCLLNPKKRKAYDAELRAQIALATAPEAQPLVAAPEIIPPPPVAPPPIAPPASDAQSDSVSEAFAFIAANARPVAAGGDLAVKTALQSRAKQRARARWLFIAAPILGIAAVTAAIVIRNSQETDDADPAAAPKRATTALAPGGQKSGPAHASSPTGEPSIAKSQDNTRRGERPNDSNAPARQEAITQPKPDDQTAAVGSTEPSSNSPPPNSLADDGAAKPAPSPPALSDVHLPLGEWVDVLRLLDTNSKMVVAGNWSRNGQEISVESGLASRVSIPVLVKGSYDFEVGFTRASGNDSVNTMLSVGSHPCEINLSGWGGRASGLEVISGHEAIDTGDPIAVRPGNLQNGHSYTLLARVRIDSADHAVIDVSLDGKPYLPRWSGDPATLGAHPRAPLPNTSELGLGAWQSPFTFHSARLKMISGSASLDPALVSTNTPPAVVKAGSGSEPNPSVPHPEGSAAGESWSARANALIQSGRSAKTPGDRAEIMRSSLKLFIWAGGADRWSSQALDLVELADNFGRQTKEGELIAGSLSAAEERIRREKTIADGVTAAQDALAKNADDPSANTIVGRFLCLQMNCWEEGLQRLAKGSDFSLTKLANLERSSPSKPASQFKLANSWWDASNKPTGLKPNPWMDPMRARAAYWYRKSASGLAGSELAMAQKRIAEQGAAANALAALADGQFPLPLGQWIDVLRFVDTNSGMVVAGSWSRRGQEITVDPGVCSRVVVPVTVSGSYDFEVDFTRTSGIHDVCTLLSVASHPCTVFVSGWGGLASGLGVVGGYWPNDPRDPFAVRPGYLTNGHRYQLLVSARVDSSDHASVDVSLDGKPYFPRWNGDPATLSMEPQFPMPNRTELGLRANQSTVTFHSAQFRMLSGSATLDSALISANH